MTESDEPPSAGGERPGHDGAESRTFDPGDGFYRELVEQAGAGILTVDADGRIVYASPGVERLLGYDPAAIVDQPFRRVLPETLAEEYRRMLGGTERAAVAEQPRSPVVLTLRHADGGEVPVRFGLLEHEHGSQRLVTGILREASPADRQSVLGGHGSLVDHLPVGVFRSGYEADSPFLEANPAMADLLDADSVAELREHTLAGRYVEDSALAETTRRLQEDGVVEDHEVRLETLSGREIWVSATMVVTEERGERYVDGMVQDVTERRAARQQVTEREEILSELTEQSPDVLWLYEGLFEDLLFVSDAYEAVWGQPEALIERDPSAPLDRVRPADLPLVERGMASVAEGESAEMEFRIDTDEGERWLWISAEPIVEDGEVVRVAGFTRDITERKRRERTLAEQRNALERVQQVTRSLRPLNNALTRAATPEEIQAMVPERLAESTAYTAAWYGEYRPGAKRVVPTEGAGLDDAVPSPFDIATVLDDGTASGDGAGQEGSHAPFVRAIQGREVHARHDPPSTGEGIPVSADDRAVAAVPVTFGGTVYGVIAVYTSRTHAFDESERGLLRELGERVGHAMNAVRSKRLLHTDRVVELEFRLGAEDCIQAGITESLDCRLVVEGFVPTGEGAVAYLSVSGATPEAVREHLLEDDQVEGARVIGTGGTGGTIEFRATDTSGAVVVEQGGTVRSLVAEDGESRLVAELPPDADSRSVVAAVQSAAPGATLTAKRTVDRPLTDPLPEPLAASLTDRQREVLSAAYRAGFFASPRHSTGEEVAETLGISSPTFYQHVRKATLRLLERLDELGVLD